MRLTRNRTHDYMLTAEELRARKQRRRRRRLLIVGGVGVAVVVVFAARPAGRAIKSWQAQRHADRALQLIEDEKWSEAKNEVTAAYQLRPSEPTALRALARFLSRTRQPQALELWDQLGKVAPLTATDLRDEASIALLAGDEVRAERAIDELMKNENAPADRLLHAQLAMRRNLPDAAHDALQKVASDARASAREKLQATALQLAIAGTHDDWRSEAWSQLKTIGESSEQAGLDALTLLAQSWLQSAQAPQAFPLTPEELARALDAHPLARAPQKLLATDLRMRAQPEQRDVLIDAAIQAWKNADVPDAVALATWLNGKGEFQRTLDAFPLERALQSRELFLQFVDALGGLGRWSEIKQLLETERFPLDPVVQRMYLARCNAQLGEKTAAENNWQRALEVARGDPAKLMALASYAEKNAAIDIARVANDEAATLNPKLRAAQQGRLRIAQLQHDTKQMHDVLAEMLKQWPNDTAVQNDEAYTRLLLGADDNAIKEASELAERLVKAEPASLPHRTLLALVRLKQNRPADALSVYQNLQISPGALTPSALAVHSAALRANGNSTDADAEAKQIPPDALLPEEAVLVNRR